MVLSEKRNFAKSGSIVVNVWNLQRFCQFEDN